VLCDRNTNALFVWHSFEQPVLCYATLGTTLTIFTGESVVVEQATINWSMPPLSVVPSSRQHTGTAIVSRHVEQKLGKQPTLKSSRYHKGGTSCMSSMEKSYFIPLSPTERYASICKITHAKCS
jgi:hypothetical protein